MKIGFSYTINQSILTKQNIKNTINVCVKNRNNNDKCV